MELKPGDFCPLIKKDCVGLKCKFFVHIQGTNPNTGAHIDNFDCAVSLLPLLLIENAKEARQGAAATEGFRNMFHELVTGSPRPDPQIEASAPKVALT